MAEAIAPRSSPPATVAVLDKLIERCRAFQRRVKDTDAPGQHANHVLLASLTRAREAAAEVERDCRMWGQIEHEHTPGSNG